MSCSRILNEYDGVQHDYTRKQGLIWQKIFLPEFALQEWRNRELLWNAVETQEKTKDSRLAREFVVALPIELDKEKWEQLLTDFITENFVSEGMCADAVIHDNDGHNPHAHIMLTVRPLDEHGKWQYKTEKEYLCVKDGVEKGFTSAEFKIAQLDGWEKQYQYKHGKKKEYMSVSAAEDLKLERISKYPKSTRYGRQNPISERWNSEEQILVWRKAWADICNTYLEKSGCEARIDHRSNAERGLNEQATIHEGFTARSMETQGTISERCELNRQIKADNSLLHELKKQVKKLSKAFANSLPAVAEALESLREHMIVVQYQLIFNGSKRNILAFKHSIKSGLITEYKNLKAVIKEKNSSRKKLTVERDKCSSLQFIQKRKLTESISSLTEEIEELKSQKEILLSRLECKETDLPEAEKKMKAIKSDIDRLEKQNVALSKQKKEDMAQYSEIIGKVSSEDMPKMRKERECIRPYYQNKILSFIRATFRERFSYDTYCEANEQIDDELGKEPGRREHQSVRERLNEIKIENIVSEKKNRDYVR